MNVISIQDNSRIQAEFVLRSPEIDGTDGSISEFLRRVGEVAPVIAPRQVHACNIISVTDENFAEYTLPNVIDCDGIFLRTNRAVATLRFADCAPVLLYPDENFARDCNFAVLLHSGFKGTVLNISGKAIAEVLEFAGENALENLNVWLGASIAQKNYPRDLDEWTQRALGNFSPENVIISGGKYYFDIRNEIRNQFLRSGILPERIFVSDMDTFSDHRCYSYRNGDKFNRMILRVKLS